MSHKSCSCGASYTPTEWATLPCRGEQASPDGDRRELRNCRRCGSTLAVPLPSSASRSVVTTACRAADLSSELAKALAQAGMDRAAAARLLEVPS